MISARLIQRGSCAADGQIIDGSVDGQRPDVASREEQRRHHKAVGRHRPASLGCRQQGGVAQAGQVFILHGRQQMLRNQPSHQPPAFAVGQRNGIAVALIGHRASNRGYGVVHGLGS